MSTSAVSSSDLAVEYDDGRGENGGGGVATTVRMLMLAGTGSSLHPDYSPKKEVTRIAVPTSTPARSAACHCPSNLNNIQSSFLHPTHPTQMALQCPCWMQLKRSYFLSLRDFPSQWDCIYSKSTSVSWPTLQATPPSSSHLSTGTTDSSMLNPSSFKVGSCTCATWVSSQANITYYAPMSHTRMCRA